MAGSLINNPVRHRARQAATLRAGQTLWKNARTAFLPLGVGGEIGCTLNVLRELYLGLYYAPGAWCARR